MKTTITINGKYRGYIKPYAGRWMAKPVDGKGRLFHTAREAADHVRQ